jgi:mannose-6-phosphate isomerase-like protein (cupin superfamily)
MKQTGAVLVVGLSCAAGLTLLSGQTPNDSVVIVRDAEVAKLEASPDNGEGQSTGFRFFDQTAKSLTFRKRILPRGSSIGEHAVSDELVYYILSGQGLFTADGKTTPVSEGTAIMMRNGAKVSLKQTGTEDLVMIMAGARPPRNKQK